MGFATVNGVVKSASESNLQKQHWHFSQTFYIKTFVISSKSSTKVLFVSSASSPIEVNFRCKKEASLRLLSSAIREQNTFQRHIFFLALHHHFTALCAWAVKIGRCLFCHCLLQIPSSFYQLCRPRWSSKKEELYNQTRQLIFCKCAWFASLLLTYSTTRRPWHGRTDLPSVVHRVAVSPIKVTFKVSALWIFPDCQMESDMSLLLILLPPHTIFFTRSKNPRFIVRRYVSRFFWSTWKDTSWQPSRPTFATTFSTFHMPSLNLDTRRSLGFIHSANRRWQRKKMLWISVNSFGTKREKSGLKKTIYQKCKWSQLDNTCLLFFFAAVLILEMSMPFGWWV